MDLEGLILILPYSDKSLLQETVGRRQLESKFQLKRRMQQDIAGYFSSNKQYQMFVEKHLIKGEFETL